MNFWNKMLSNITDTVLPKKLDDDTLFLQIEEALQEEKIYGILSKAISILIRLNAFRINGTQHIVLQKRKQEVYCSLWGCLDRKFIVWHQSLLIFMNIFLLRHKHLMSA